METGKIIKSANFHTIPYWVIKCNNPNLIGARNGELPIDPLSLPEEWGCFMGSWYFRSNHGREVKFELVEIGDDETLKWYARIIK